MANTSAVATDFGPSFTGTGWDIVNATLAGYGAQFSDIIAGYATTPKGVASPFVVTPAAYTFDSAYFVTRVADQTGVLLCGVLGPTGGLEAWNYQAFFSIKGSPTIYVDPLVIQPGATVAGDSGLTYGTPETYDEDAHRYLRVSRSGTTITYEKSPDGATWTTMWTFTDAGVASFPTCRLYTNGTRSLLRSINTAPPPLPAPDPVPPPHEPPDWLSTAPDYGTDYPDNFDPDAVVPAAPGVVASSVLDVIRAFSAAVRRPVRLTSPTSIELVDPNDPPLPTDWIPADANTMYHSGELSIAASGETLRLSAGGENVTAAAQMVANDVRIIKSDWQLPNQLPVYGPGLRPAPVKHVTYTMTPKVFTAAVEFAFPAVPAAARR